MYCVSTTTGSFTDIQQISSSASCPMIVRAEKTTFNSEQPFQCLPHLLPHARIWFDVVGYTTPHLIIFNTFSFWFSLVILRDGFTNWRAFHFYLQRPAFCLSSIRHGIFLSLVFTSLPGDIDIGEETRGCPCRSHATRLALPALLYVLLNLFHFPSCYCMRERGHDRHRLVGLGDNTMTAGPWIHRDSLTKTTDSSAFLLITPY